jgi:hypothetical protein
LGKPKTSSRQPFRSRSGLHLSRGRFWLLAGGDRGHVPVPGSASGYFVGDDFLAQRRDPAVECFTSSLPAQRDLNPIGSAVQWLLQRLL